MTWSTRQIADLAGTTVRAVRHYHEVGLLPEPERHANGYKQYGVAHLVRVVRIKRLTDLGLSLEFDDLPSDADEHTRQDLAERLVPLIRDLFDEHPGLEGLNGDAPGGGRYAERTVGLAINDVHNPAQLDVLQRIARLRQTP